MSTGQLEFLVSDWTMADDTLFPISKLQERYSLSSRQAVYDRINALKIEPAARGKLSSVQLDKLDKLDKHLKSGGTLSDFAEVEVMPLPKDMELMPAPQPEPFTDFVELVKEIATAIKPAADPLQHYEALERAAANQWILTTTEVKSLIGTTPKGDEYTYGAFAFVRAGRLGRSAGWRVMKVVE
jgi:hypothetical protein